MATLIVTKDKGGAGQTSGMTVVAPGQEASLKAVQIRAHKAGLDGRVLADIISAIVMHERAAARFARAAGVQTEVAELRKLHKSLANGYTERVTMLESLMTEIGAPALYVSPGARMAGFLAEAPAQAPLVAGSIDAEALEFTLLDVTLTLAEKSHANARVLLAIAASAKASSLATALDKAAQTMVADAAALEQVRAAREFCLVAAVGMKEP